MHAITNQWNKTARSEGTWGFLAVLLRYSLMVFNFTHFPGRLWFWFPWPQLTAHLPLLRGAAGAGGKSDSCCALVSPHPPPQLHVEPLQPRWRMSGVGWCCAGFGITQLSVAAGEEFVLPCFSCSCLRRGGRRGRGQVCVMRGMILGWCSTKQLS